MTHESLRIVKSRLFRHWRRRRLQGGQSRQSAALGPRLRGDFVFTIGADPAALETRADTSKAASHLPLYHWRSVAEMRLPKGCRLVGVELLDEAVELPNFAHPSQAAYVLGPERGALSPELVARCHHVLRIPTAFSLNLATAGAIVMYDRLRCLGRFAARPIAPGGGGQAPPPHVQGAPRKRRARV
jgi:tRNA(Leu) C34 or U34 (ribose-2'-O)-methylase TrmL